MSYQQHPPLSRRDAIAVLLGLLCAGLCGALLLVYCAGCNTLYGEPYPYQGPLKVGTNEVPAPTWADSGRYEFPSAVFTNAGVTAYD